MELFNGIKPLFANKPLLVILNKIDVVRPDEFSEEKKEMMKVFDQEGNILLDLHNLSLIHISSPRDQRGSRMPSSA